MNPHTLATLRLLDATRFRSGEEIAQALGVTRATIWNAIREAEALGVEFDKVRGSGYRLIDAPTWLDARAIAQAAGPHAARFSIEVAASVDSTNAQLLARIDDGAPSGTVLVAEVQRAGRGRRGRSWHAPLGGALTFSLLARFDAGANALTGLSLVVGLAVAEALATLGARDVRVKWPNDLVLHGAKLAGILIEVQGDALGPAVAVIGVGINVRVPAAQRAAIDQPVADLVDAGVRADRNVVLGAVLASLAQRIDQFVERGFAALEPAFRRLHALHDAPVRLALPDGRDVHGTVVGVAPDGALQVRDDADGRVRHFHGGEVSARLVTGAASSTASTTASSGAWATVSGDSSAPSASGVDDPRGSAPLRPRRAP
jgi:BirA family biotin operon repressor/biotin-[acetyl-CoA-carboxylase] ligase